MSTSSGSEVMSVSAAKARRDELERDVKVMRDLGVARWGDIILGPPPGQPRKELSAEEQMARIEAQARSEHNLLFGATSTRPRIGKPPGAPR